MIREMHLNSLGVFSLILNRLIQLNIKKQKIHLIKYFIFDLPLRNKKQSQK